MSTKTKDHRSSPMRYFPLFVALLAGCTPQPEPKPAPAPATEKPVRMAWSAEMQTIAEGNNEFACDLFAQLRAEPGNLFFSPFSIHTALAMTADGARGATLDEMVKVLHLPKEAKARLAAGEVSKYYAAGGDGYELAVANNLWGQQGYPWKADFLERLRTSYGAELTPLDFKDDANREAARKTINASVEKTTRDKIKDLLKADDLTDTTRLILTNAIYFKGQWLTEFDKKHTKDAPFTLADGKKKDVPLMALITGIRYLENEEFEAVELPYKGKEISMVVLLPRKHDGLPALEKQLTVKSLAERFKKMKPSWVYVLLPKFKSENRILLADLLAKKMGMPSAFDEELADLLGIATPPPKEHNLYISKVIHQSFVEVNEEGTEAAAATGVVVPSTAVSSGPQPFYFRADHPFLYLIRDTKSGNILFLGRYTGP